LDIVLGEVLENRPKGKRYFISANEDQILIKDDAKNPTKTLMIRPDGKDGICVDIGYADGAQGRDFSILLNPKSTLEEIINLRMNASKFFDTALSELILINAKPEENKKND
jgi:hypothetical protein